MHQLKKYLYLIILIIFSAILSIFIFNQYPDILSTIGYIVVFSAAFYTFLYNKKLDKMEKEN